MAAVQAHEAAISTVTVEIKTLMVSNRQMTQAIFRQLEEGWLWAQGRYGELAHHWGRVNYHFPGCCPASPDPRTHVHVVYSLGGELYRSTIWEDLHRGDVRVSRRLPQLFIAG